MTRTLHPTLPPRHHLALPTFFPRLFPPPRLAFVASGPVFSPLSRWQQPLSNLERPQTSHRFRWQTLVPTPAGFNRRAPLFPHQIPDTKDASTSAPLPLPRGGAQQVYLATGHSPPRPHFKLIQQRRGTAPQTTPPAPMGAMCKLRGNPARLQTCGTSAPQSILDKGTPTESPSSRTFCATQANSQAGRGFGEYVLRHKLLLANENGGRSSRPPDFHPAG